MRGPLMAERLTLHRHPPEGEVGGLDERVRQNQAEIYMLAMDGANPKPEVFFPGEAGKEGAEFSGDRQYVSYVSALTGQREIYIRPYQRPGQRITASVDGGREPVWARNGEVFYRSLTGEKMFAVSVKTAPALTVGSTSAALSGALLRRTDRVSPRAIRRHGGRPALPHDR